MKKHLLIILLFPIIFFSCQKEEIAANGDLTGRWLLVETYDGYVMGGSFTWHPVDFQHSHYLQFSASGNYELENNYTDPSPLCTGTYQVLPDSTLAINSNCNTTTERGKISLLTNKNLIIDHQVIEGTIRQKYRALK